MTPLDTQSRIGTLALYRPDAIARLQKLGIDLALEADRTVEEACAMRDVDARFFLMDVLDDDREGSPGLGWEAVQPAKGSWQPAAFLAL